MIVQSQVFNYCNCVRLALLSSSFTYIISSYCREDSISNFRNCILTLRLLSMLSTPNYIKTLSVWHKDDSLIWKTSNNFDMLTLHYYFTWWNSFFYVETCYKVVHSSIQSNWNLTLYYQSLFVVALYFRKKLKNSSHFFGFLNWYCLLFFSLLYILLAVVFFPES